jgi:methionyl-tRNA formyltransferase
MSARLRVVFFGSPACAVPSLEAVVAQHDVLRVVTQPERPAGRGKVLTPPPIKGVALRLGLSVVQPATLKDGAVATELADLAPDMFIVVAYGRILPTAMLAIPRFGSWNVHASLLPKLRGAAPIQWAIMRGEARTGISIMALEAGLDTGPVAARAEVAITDDDTTASLSARLAPLGAKLLVDTLPGIVSGAISAVPQMHGEATLAPPLRKEDGAIDFRAAAKEVSARVRGVDPWPGATGILGGEPIKLFRPSVVASGGAPGEVLRAGSEGLMVACGSGAVSFGELQLPGRKRLPTGAVLSGHPVAVGSRFSTAVSGD